MSVELVICGRDAAIERLRDRSHGFTHLVSIQDAWGTNHDDPIPGAHLVPCALSFWFDDCTIERQGYQLATDENIIDIISMGQAIKAHAAPPQARALFHCEQGRSRSTAAALIALYVYYGAGYEHAAWMHVLQAAPRADPNEHMVAIADRLLYTHGALAREIQNSKKAKRGSSK